MSPIDFLHDLLNPDLAFLPRALAVATMSAVVCGVIGSHVVLRGMAFIGDAVAHAVFPGLAVAFVVSGNLVLGGTVAGVVTAVLVAVFAQNRRLREDSVIGVFFVAAFALGVVIISRAPGYAGSLSQFLFGSITGVPASDLLVVAVMGLAVLATVLVLHKELVTVSLDRESARALGVPVFALDLVLYVLVTLAVVISVQTIGNVLVLALLVTPAATARLLTDRLPVMMALAPAIGGVSALVGLYVSWSWDLPTGGTIVLVLTAVFLLAWFLAPRQGVLARLRRRGVAPEETAEASPAEGSPAEASPADAAATAPGTAADSARPAERPRSRAAGWAMGAVAALGVALLVTAASWQGAAEAEPSGRRPPATGRATPTATPSTDVSASAGAVPTGRDATPVAQLADPSWVVSTAAATGVPERAMAAYAGASLATAATHPACHLGWNALAAIGEVESAHGTVHGGRLGEDGVVRPALTGPPLDGHGVTQVADTDGGVLDGDRAWDRAVGPMQVVPTTWLALSRDADLDGRADPQQIDDAALTAAALLCETGADLGTDAAWAEALHRYNPSDDYAARVSAAAARLAAAAA